MAYMTENGFDVSMLFGIPNFYHKFGYATVLPETYVEIDRGRFAHTNSRANAFQLEMPQDKLIQLMMGRRSIEDLAIEPDVSITEEIIPVLETLFPLDHPHVWWPDRF